MSPPGAALDHGLDLARERIGRLTGLSFPRSRIDAFADGVRAGMERAGSGGLEGYLDRLDREPALLDDLVSEITIGETYFFRDPRQYALIRERIVPELRVRAGGRGLRVWSAGCASGEEPYSLAILLAEEGVPVGAGAPARVLGTDLSRRALARAARARYRPWSLRGVPPADVARWFRRTGDELTLAPEMRRAVELRYLNLAVDAYPSLSAGVGSMDLILCRNVLIYFDAETVAVVCRRLVASLAPGGWLLVGASDPRPSEFAPCEVVVTDAGLAYRRAEGARTGVEPPLPRPRDAPPRTAADPVPRTPAHPRARTPHPPSPPAAPPPATRPEPTRARPTLADAERAYAAKDYPATTEVARALAADGDGDGRAWVLLVRSLANDGELDRAGRTCATALDRCRTCPELAYLHGVLLGEAGRAAEAAAALRTALYLDRTLAVAHLALAGRLRELGDRPGADRSFANAERLLAALPPEAEVPASDGEAAGRLAALARTQRALLAEVRA